MGADPARGRGPRRVSDAPETGVAAVDRALAILGAFREGDAALTLAVIGKDGLGQERAGARHYLGAADGQGTRENAKGGAAEGPDERHVCRSVADHAGDASRGSEKVWLNGEP